MSPTSEVKKPLATRPRKTRSIGTITISVARQRTIYRFTTAPPARVAHTTLIRIGPRVVSRPCAQQLFNTRSNSAIVIASTNPGGRYGRRETCSGTDDRRDQPGRGAEGSSQACRQEGKKGGQEGRQEGDAEESQEGQKGRQEIFGEEVGQEGREESRQESSQEEEKESQEVEALSACLPGTLPCKSLRTSAGGFCLWAPARRPSLRRSTKNTPAPL